MTLKTGADLLIEQMLIKNIKNIYLYPGGTISPIIDAAFRNKINLVRPRNEQGAGYMGLAASRLEGKTSVIMATSGPGATNMVTPVADAFYDSLPCVIIIGQIGTGDLDKDKSLRQRGFQECDTLSIYKSITKAQFQPRSPIELAKCFVEAYKIASSGRFGPVLIDAPMNVQREKTTENFIEIEKNIEISELSNKEKELINSFSEAFAKSKRPLIIGGAGIISSNAISLTRELIYLKKSAFSASLPALGVIPTNDELSLGFHGHTGFRASGIAIQQADLLLVLGSRLDVRQTGSEVNSFAENAKIYRIEIDETEIKSARTRIDKTLNMDVSKALALIIENIKSRKIESTNEWVEYLKNLKLKHRMNNDENQLKLKPQMLVRKFSEAITDNEIYCVTGVGSHQHWAARHFEFDYPKRRWFSSCGHGTMGFDLPTAAGLGYLRPDATIVCFVGDGSFMMNIQELAYIATLKAKIIIVVMDNERLGIVGQFQKFNWDHDLTCEKQKNPDFAAISKSFGINSVTLKDPKEISYCINLALKNDGPFLVHALIDSDEDISPMLLAGHRIDDMWPAFEGSNQ
jgi:acetolactate synthase-1/2/3 large subunit